MAETKEDGKQALMEYQMIEQHTKQLQQHLEMAQQQIMEIAMTLNSLDEFKSIKAGKEIFVPINSGIFAKATIKDTSELLVNVGSGVVVLKDVDGAKKLISGQLEEVKKAQKQIIDQLEQLAYRASQIEEKIQGIQPQ